MTLGFIVKLNSIHTHTGVESADFAAENGFASDSPNGTCAEATDWDQTDVVED